ncbi:MAG: NADH-ubiquinone oxidoreductase-F iron-sulfur binding region domain-containing protein [Bacteroidales bacterium]
MRANRAPSRTVSSSSASSAFLEGILLSSYALKANTCYILNRGEFKTQMGTLNKAIREAHANGFLGKNIKGSGFDLEVHVHSGAGAYICGEETAQIESLEGKRGNPRLKPPFPAVKGLYGCPTVVNNVETLAAVVPVLEMGGVEYSHIGKGPSTGTKLISACGNINNPGVYEIEMGLPVEEFIYSPEYCNGIAGNKKLKAVIPGGSSVPVLPAAMMITTAKGEPRLMCYDPMAEGGFESGTMLGSGGFYVYDEDACMVQNTWNLARFYHHESCGRCSPCREGTGWMERFSIASSTEKGRSPDLDLLVSISKKSRVIRFVHWGCRCLACCQCNTSFQTRI